MVISLKVHVNRKVWIRSIAVILYCMIAIWVNIRFLGVFLGNVNVGKLIIWNYAVGLFLCLIVILITRGQRSRPLPVFPHKIREIGFAVAILLIDAGIMLLVWTHLHFIMRAIALLGHKLGLSNPEVVLKLGNALFVLPISLFIFFMCFWRLKSNRKTLVSMTWKDGIIVIVFLGVTTAIAFLRNQIFGLPNTNLFPPFSLASILVFVFQFFINGWQEETLYRGYLVPLMLSFLRSPFLSLWFASIFFDASHIISFIYGFQFGPIAWWQYILFCIFPFQPTGWVFGVLYYRTRRVLPGALYHTYLLWGFPFVR